MKSAFIKPSNDNIHGIFLLSPLPSSPLGLESRLCEVSPVGNVTVSRQDDLTRVEVTLKEPRENWVPIHRELKAAMESHFRCEIGDVELEEFESGACGAPCLAVDAC